MTKILGTDSDLLGHLPDSPDRGKREADTAKLVAALEGVELEDPAVLELLARFKEQTRFVGSTKAEVNSDGEQEAIEGDHDLEEGSKAAQELSPEQLNTLTTLKANQTSKETKLKTGLEWSEVEAKLKKSPEKLTVLARLIARGGEPTATARLSNGNFRFDELSEESPIGDRTVDFDRVEEIAEKLGAEPTKFEVYDTFGSKGIVLDKNTVSWLQTPKRVREHGYAYFGRNGRAHKNYVMSPDQGNGLRCSLEV